MRDTDLHIKNIAYLLFKQKSVILKLFVTTVFLVFLVSFYLVPKYKVQSELLLDLDEKKTTDISPSLIKKDYLLDLVNKVNLEKSLIKNPVVLQETAEKFSGLEQKIDYDKIQFRSNLRKTVKSFMNFFSAKKDKSEKGKTDRRIKFLTKRVKVKNNAQSNIITVSLLAGDADFGVELLRNLLDNYLSYRAKSKRYHGVSSFFEEQIAKSQGRLHKLEEELSAFQEKEKILDYANEIKRISRNIETYDKAIATKHKQNIALRNELNEIVLNTKEKKSLNIPSIKLIKQPFLSKIYNRLVELRMELIKQKNNLSEKDAKILAMTKEIKMLEQELNKEVSKILLLKKSALRRSEKEERALQNTKKKLVKRGQAFPQKKAKIDNLKRSIHDEMTTLSSLVSKRNQEIVSEAKDSRLDDIKVITPPTYLSQKVTPRIGLNLLIGSLLGLTIGLGAALLKEYFDQTISREEDISTYFNLPVLGTIQELEN